MPHRRVTCPDCRIPMGIHERRGLLIDRCHECGGTWLDRGELRELKKGERMLARVGEQGSRSCLLCAERMRYVEFGPVVADWCRTCGLYFDATELEQLVPGLVPVRRRRRRMSSLDDDFPLTIQVLGTMYALSCWSP